MVAIEPVKNAVFCKKRFQFTLKAAAMYRAPKINEWGGIKNRAPQEGLLSFSFDIQATVKQVKVLGVGAWSQAS